MADNQLRSIIWTVVIIFLLLTTAGIMVMIFYIPQNTGGSGVKIAILDSGLNLDIKLGGYKVSKQLEDRVISMKSFATTEFGFDQNYSVVDDTDVYHGTVIAVTIAGKSLGIAPESELIIGRCVDQEGTASYEALLAAFKWAVYEADADIVNISLGGEMVYNDTVVEEINKATVEEGVLTVVSAGNNGDDTGYSLTTINGPSDALQAIAVGATTAAGIAYYSSLGPLRDHSIKPDLVDSGYAFNLLGTSFAAPKVAARAALLMSWCIENNYKTSPGLLKAALMKSAAEESTYLEYLGGAGIADVDKAKEIISDAQQINGVPIVSYIQPTTIPYGITTIFQGDIWSFPLTIVSPIEQEYSISSNLDSDSTIVDIPSTVTINQTSLIDCKLVVPSDYPIGTHIENLTITSEYGEALTVSIEVEIAEPELTIGFDVIYSTWQFDHLIGQFNEMRNYLADEDVSLIELTSKDNYTSLDNYDAIILADPCSYSLRFNEEDELEAFYNPIEDSTISLLVDYVNNGGGLFILTTDSSSSNFTELNKLLTNFEITAENWTVPGDTSANEDGEYTVVEITDMNSTHPVTAGISSFDYHGAALNITGANAQAIAWGTASLETETDTLTERKPVLAVFQAPTASSGRVVVTGSNFMIDNWGINNGYEAIDNLDMLLNIVEWVTNSSLNLEVSNIDLPPDQTANSFGRNQLLADNSLDIFNSLRVTMVRLLKE